jgi:hypothetical protein
MQPGGTGWVVSDRLIIRGSATLASRPPRFDAVTQGRRSPDAVNGVLTVAGRLKWPIVLAQWPRLPL